VPLERQVADIVRGLLMEAEKDARSLALLQHKWVIENHERNAREATLAAERAKAERSAREKAAAITRIEALLDGADALERAERIRRYLAAVRAAHGAASEIGAIGSLEKWVEWALTQADVIDPLKSGQVWLSEELRVAAVAF